MKLRAIFQAAPSWQVSEEERRLSGRMRRVRERQRNVRKMKKEGRKKPSKWKPLLDPFLHLLSSSSSCLSSVLLSSQFKHHVYINAQTIKFKRKSWKTFDELPLFSFLISIEEAHGAKRDERNYWSKSMSREEKEGGERDDVSLSVGTRICEDDKSHKVDKNALFALLPIFLLYKTNTGIKERDSFAWRIVMFFLFSLLISLTYFYFFQYPLLTHPGKLSWYKRNKKARKTQ